MNNNKNQETKVFLNLILIPILKNKKNIKRYSAKDF
jgi:hypothetical protein